MLNNLNFLNKGPLFVCAPMVDQSQLPFRMLVRKYGSNLCYTPMLHSKMMITQKNYKEIHFTTCEADRPLVAQICGDDPDSMVKAAKMLQSQVDAIDVNFGCPQGIAKRGHYGSFLLQQPELVYKIVKALSQNIKVPIFCKIRILKTQQKTFNIVNKVLEAGCSVLTVHGRTKQQNKERVGQCDWSMIKKIKQYVNIPLFANGGIYNYQDVQRCIQETGVDGVMSAEALLQNPALFSGKIHDLDEIALQYLDLTQKYKGASPSCIRAHLFKILYKGLSQNVDLRQRMAKANLQQFRPIVEQLRQRRKQKKLDEKFGWYHRHWKKAEQIQIQGQQQQKKEQNKSEIEKVIIQEKQKVSETHNN